MRTFIVKQATSEEIKTIYIDADGFRRDDEDAAVIFYVNQGFAATEYVGMFFNVEEITYAKIVKLDE